jgi:ABC-type glycerol-3-phosphate transport system permease component
MHFRYGKPTYILTRISMILILLIILLPLIWIVSLSLRHEDKIYESYGYIIPKDPTIENYPKAVNYVEDKLKLSFLRMFANSGLVTFSSIAIAVTIAIFGAYGIANYRFKGKSPTFNFIILSMMIPAQVIFIPLFYLFAKINITNVFALIIIYAQLGIPISVLLLRGSFEQLPRELRDASQIDGASDFQHLIKIILPLSKPTIASCIIFLFLQTWNEFLLALVFIPSGSWQTLPAAVSKIGGGQYVVPWGIYSASIVIAAFPVIIVFSIFQRWFIEGVTLGALKG